MGSLNTLDEQCNLLSCVGDLCSEVQNSAALVESLDRQVVVLSAEIYSGRREMTRLEEFGTIAQRQLADAQSV